MSVAFGQSTARTVLDINLIELARSRIPGLRKEATTGGGEWHGACPSCGGTDRFVVNGAGGKDGRGLFWCRTCEASGDAIDLVKLLDGCDTAIAFQALGIGSSDWRPGFGTPALATPQEPVEPPPAEWRARAADWLTACEATLWSPLGAKALAYLHGRGLTDETIRVGRLGYSPEDTHALRSEWGLDDTSTNGSFAVTKLTIPRGIVLPYIVDGEPWRLEVRRPVTAIDVCCAKGQTLQAGNDATGRVWRTLKELSFATPTRLATSTGLALDTVQECLDWLRSQQLLDTPAKYLAIAGSANTVWGVDSWQPGRPGVLVEGVLNGLSVLQDVPGVNVAALGAATHGRKVKWVMQLARWQQVLIALDSETDESKQAMVEQAASWWLDALAPTAKRWRPLAKDCNAMLCAGDDLAAWVAAGYADTQPDADAPARLGATCATCGDALTVAGTELCARCANPAPKWRGIDGLDAPAPAWETVFTPEPTPAKATPISEPSADYWWDELSTKLESAPPEVDSAWQAYMDAMGTADAGAFRLILLGSQEGRWLIRTYTEWKTATEQGRV
jgi:hypothetical protein